MYGGQFHLFVDGGGVYVEGTTEDIGEADDVIDLIGIVGTARGHQYVGTGVHRILVADLRHGVGEGEDHRILGHRLDHVLREHVALGEAYKHVGILHGLVEGMDVGARSGEELLLFVQVGAAGGDDTLRVEHHDVLLPGTDGHI